MEPSVAPAEGPTNIAGLPRVTIDVSAQPSALDLERLRELIFHRIGDSKRGVVVDCTGVRRTVLDTLVCLRVAQRFAQSEGKRFALYGITPEFRELLREYAEWFDFHVFGERTRNTVKPAKETKPARPSFWATPRGKQIRRIALPILLILPVVAGVEYYFLMNQGVSDAVIVTKSFESGDAFTLRGQVTEVGYGNQRMPLVGCKVFLSRSESPKKSEAACWMVHTGDSGSFQIQLPINQRLPRANIDVCIVSGSRSRLSTHSVFNGRPVEIACVFERQ